MSRTGFDRVIGVDSEILDAVVVVFERFVKVLSVLFDLFDGIASDVLIRSRDEAAYSNLSEAKAMVIVPMAVALSIAGIGADFIVPEVTFYLLL